MLQVDVILSTWNWCRCLPLKLNQKLESEDIFRPRYFYEVFVRATAFGDELLRTDAEGDTVDWEGGRRGITNCSELIRYAENPSLCGKEYKPPRDSYYRYVDTTSYENVRLYTKYYAQK